MKEFYANLLDGINKCDLNVTTKIQTIHIQFCLLPTTAQWVYIPYMFRLKLFGHHQGDMNSFSRTCRRCKTIVQ
jgi:hypothetical protein